jgi:hypothetical protein
VHGPGNNEGQPKIADRKQDGIPGHEPNLWIWYRIPGIPDFTPIFDLIREEKILSAILGPMGPHAEFKDNKAEPGSGLSAN